MLITFLIVEAAPSLRKPRAQCLHSADLPALLGNSQSVPLFWDCHSSPPPPSLYMGSGNPNLGPNVVLLTQQVWLPIKPSGQPHQLSYQDMCCVCLRHPAKKFLTQKHLLFTVTGVHSAMLLSLEMTVKGLDTLALFCLLVPIPVTLGHLSKCCVDMALGHAFILHQPSICDVSALHLRVAHLSCLFLACHFLPFFLYQLKLATLTSDYSIKVDFAMLTWCSWAIPLL